MQTMPEFLFLSFEEFSKYCFDLVIKINQLYQGQKIDYLISIQRGGAVMSKVISDALNVPIATIVVSSYQNLQQVREPFVSQELSIDIRDKHIIVLDEICDSGDTLKLVCNYLSQYSPASLRTAVLVLKPHSQFKPDFSAMETSKWVVFPGELRETAEAILELGDVTTMVVDQFHEYAYKHGATPQLLEELGFKYPPKT